MPTSTFFNLAPEKREQITQIATAEFAEHAYRSVSISRIVAQAGIAKGSFYQYFEGKEDLYGYLLDLLVEKKSQFLSLDRPDPQNVGIFAYLRWIAEIGAQFEQVYPELSRVGYRAFYLGEYPAAFTDRTSQMAGTFYTQLVELGKRQGDIAPSLDTELAAFLFNTILSNLPAYLLQHLPPDSQPTEGESGATISLLTDVFGQILGILEHGMSVRTGEESQ
ncbi:MAG: TetR/AcrR family transcriptional regulator [Caldilineaceae bacterium]|nr:TetR/AcrR family transcriptional regulator [Caldilineaceae bacterium]